MTSVAQLFALWVQDEGVPGSILGRTKLKQTPRRQDQQY